MTASYNLSLLGSNYNQGGTGAVARTTASKLQESVSVKDFGAVGDGTTDDTAAIQAAINAVSSAGGGKVRFTRGTYKVNSSLTVPAYVILSGEGKKSTKIIRAFTGDFITSFNGYCGIEFLTIDGQTGTYGLGRGVLMSGATPNAYMLQAEITNFSQSCLEFGADAGSTFRAVQCDFFTTGAVGSVAAVRVNGTDTAATSRHFTDSESGGCTIFDFGGCNDFYVTGGYTNGLIFGASSSKVMITNQRVGAAAGSITIAGTSHRIRNCVYAVAVTLNCTNSTFHCEVPSYAITDNGTSNDVFIQNTSYNPVFSASGGGAAIGNGNIKGAWSRQGTLINVQVDLTFGTTTAVGTGAFQFSLPVPDYIYGPVQIGGGGTASNGASSAFATFVCRITPGSQQVTLFYVDTAGVLQNVGAVKPAAIWGSGSNIRFSFSYNTP